MDTQLVIEWKGLIIQGRMTGLWRKRLHRGWQGGTNCLGWHIWLVAPHPRTHLTVLPSPEQTFIKPSREFSLYSHMYQSISPKSAH